jgi:concanavalin A-like lectin/glucanase superfamily protein/putative tail protein
MAWQDDPVKYTPLGGGNILAQWGAGGKFAPGSYIYRQADPADILAGRADPNNMAWYPVANQTVPPATSPVVSTSTGVNPTETNYSLYGHPVPLSVLGLARIGGEIIAGPWVENGNATFCISFGVPADPGGTRTLREIAFDSEVVWTAADGFSTEGFTYRYYPGTLTQAADPIEIAHYGTSAVAYRPQMLIWFENLPLQATKFKKIPYVAALIADSVGDMINMGEGFTRLALSPWVNYTSAQFETVGITDASGGMIFAADAEFLATIQQFGRFYQSWDILQTDKLRIVDRGAQVTADINLNRSRMSGQVMLSRAARDSVPRELELSTIDPDADYTIVPSKAVFPRVPVAVSSSVSSESVFLPTILDAHTRQSLVTYALYQQEVSRKRVAATAMLYGLELEPGDMVALLDLGDDFVDEVFKVVETTHGVNYAIELTLESILRCSLVADDSTDPDWVGVVLLLGFEDINGSTGAPGLTDESSRHHGTAAAVNGPAITTSQHKFGLASLGLLSSIAEIQFPDSADWRLSTSNSDQFTVEVWARFINFVAGGLMVGQIAANLSWALQLSDTAGRFEFRSSVDGLTSNVILGSGSTTLEPSVWHHIAVDKDASGKIRLYKNGVPVASVTPVDSSMALIHQALHIGCVSGNNGMQGYLDEVRITKGVARYQTDASFTPPTAAFPRGGPL